MFPSLKRYFLLDRRDVAYLKFILEAYEGLATLSTLERTGEEALVRLTVLPSCAADLESLINALRQDIAMTETAPPPGGDAESKERDHA
jgi:hypothetical protein